MTSKEMEARSGVPRANIRYYEAEGLLHPARAANGYRAYSEEDLAVLEPLFWGRDETVNSASQLPPNRGELTVAEFAENFNRQAKYLGMRSAGWLDQEGL